LEKGRQGNPTKKEKRGGGKRGWHGLSRRHSRKWAYFRHYVKKNDEPVLKKRGLYFKPCHRLKGEKSGESLTRGKGGEGPS